MKKAILIILTVVLVLLVAVMSNFEAVIDALPIDQSGWVTDETGSYYLNEKGDPVTGWQTLDGKLYYFDEKGIMQTGELETDSGKYYLNESGQPVTGWQTLDGAEYYFDENGIMQTGWLETEEGKFYLSEDGTVTTGLVNLDGGRYFFDESGHPVTLWKVIDGETCYVREDGAIQSGWFETEEGTYYLNDNAGICTGWTELDDGRYYLDENGLLHKGWLEIDGVKYYADPESGKLTTGMRVIDDVTYYFTSTGANIILVNPWNYIPDDYEVNLVTLESGRKVAAEMQDALLRMLSDCEAAGHHPYIKSAYRSHSDQQANFSRILEKYGYDYTMAAMVVAVPGTSEHQLGLAVDITDNYYRDLDYEQENTATQKWLMEHCWEYGFILRYPNSKSDITGIIYEPWHYRYVGTELSLELQGTGICLEEYLDALTADGSTCGNPDA
ncbi:MAG: D-alanyl-D-alanine carboxypeptidase family protein [Oscillospiraceae bacterium]|nr:D-alanyl-D-alanine carboxypeptidase family protein [Oscillospiraceae bacterium]